MFLVVFAVACNDEEAEPNVSKQAPLGVQRVPAQTREGVRTRWPSKAWELDTPRPPSDESEPKGNTVRQVIETDKALVARQRQYLAALDRQKSRLLALPSAQREAEQAKLKREILGE